jgi:hypothetical protein
MITTFRVLTNQEMTALKVILSVEFRDHEKLQSQVNDLSMKSVDENLFEFASIAAGSKSKIQKKFGVPVECTYKDKDGAIVYVDLFVNECDNLAELEIWKPDGSAIETYFADADLSVKSQPS